MARATDELLTAYLDGVAELTADERKRVEAVLADAATRADADATRELLGQLRALPGEGHEPDWAELERSIRCAVGPAMPRPWWKRWQWLVPIGALAATAAAALLWLHGAPEQAIAPRPAAVAPAAAVAPVPVQEPAAAEPSLVWLDDDAIDVDQIDPGSIEVPETIATGDSDALVLVPTTDLDWVDQLDDKSLERAETWLENKKT
ncbi:MAG TPA: hypothetical protein VGF94_07850 [Kofleriaceae bacterium]|jgi:hypothetical protein